MAWKVDPAMPNSIPGVQNAWLEDYFPFGAWLFFQGQAVKLPGSTSVTRELHHRISLSKMYFGNLCEMTLISGFEHVPVD